jgi:diaminopimelate decarboxylase
VGGPNSSFGIWHEHIQRVQDIAAHHNLTITRVHSHIGCGADPIIWDIAAKQTLAILEQFPQATILNLGGGFKVARYPGEKATDLQNVGRQLSSLLAQFADRTGRELHIEIEPGTFLVANAGTLLSSVIDITNTGKNDYTFAKLDTGMNDIMRPALHASQHPIIPLSSAPKPPHGYVIVGHNCESTDLLTPDPDDSEAPLPRLLPELSIGELVAIEGTGAYCSAMNMSGYNSFATPNEVIITTSGEIKLVNRSITIDQFMASEA